MNAIQKLVYSSILPRQTSEAWLCIPKKPKIHQTDRSAMLSTLHYVFLFSFTIVSCYPLKWWIIFLSSQGSSVMLKHYGQALFAIANSFVIRKENLSDVYVWGGISECGFVFKFKCRRCHYLRYTSPRIEMFLYPFLTDF